MTGLVGDSDKALKQITQGKKCLNFWFNIYFLNQRIACNCLRASL